MKKKQQVWLYDRTYHSSTFASQDVMLQRCQKCWSQMSKDEIQIRCNNWAFKNDFEDKISIQRFFIMFNLKNNTDTQLMVRTWTRSTKSTLTINAMAVATFEEKIGNELCPSLIEDIIKVYLKFILYKLLLHKVSAHKFSQALHKNHPVMSTMRNDSASLKLSLISSYTAQLHAATYC